MTAFTAEHRKLLANWKTAPYHAIQPAIDALLAAHDELAGLDSIRRAAIIAVTAERDALAAENVRLAERLSVLEQIARNPTDAMVNAGAYEDIANIDGTVSPYDHVRKIWRTMYDAAALSAPAKGNEHE